MSVYVFGVFSVCKLFFFPSFRCVKDTFLYFLFFLLLLRYVKFSSHIRRKKSSNKVQLTHGGSTAFHSFFFFFYFKKFLFRFRISKGNTDRGNRYLSDASFIVSFCLFVSFIFFLLVSMKEKEETKRLKRFQSAVTAPFPLPAAPSIGLHPRARNINISNNIQIIVNIIIYRRSAIANDPSFVEETLINRKKVTTRRTHIRK